MNNSIQIFISEMSLLKRAKKNGQGKKIIFLFSDVVLEKEHEVLPVGQHQYNSIFNGVVLLL